MLKYVLLLHVLGATVWTGGHLVLALVVLPRVLREKSPARLIEFESASEKIGMPALVIQVLTGLWLAHHLLPHPADWFSSGSTVAHLIQLKLGLLLATAALALDARLRIIPRLDAGNLVSLAWHIVPVTLLSVLFVVVGIAFRTGGF